MLGEPLGEGRGKITNVRVLPTEGQQVKVEATWQGTATLLGQELTGFGTYEQTVRPGGILYGAGHVLFASATGEVADWVGGGIGRPVGPGFAASYGVWGSFQGAQGALAPLTAVANVVEYRDSSPRLAQCQSTTW